MNGIARQALRFGAVGVLNTGIGLGAIWLAMWVGISPILSNAIGYAIGLVVSFSLNRNWTFRRDDGSEGAPTVLSDMTRFAAAFLASWLLNISVVWTGLQLTEISPYLLQIAGMLTYTVSFFLFCRIWAFKR